MQIVETKKYLLIKKILNGDIKSVFELLDMMQKTKDLELVGPVIYCLKPILLFVHPSISMRVYATNQGRAFTEKSMREDYLYLVRLISALHYDCKEYEYGVYWAKKAMDLYVSFPFKFNFPTGEKLEGKSWEYECALKLFKKYESYFDYDQYYKLNGIYFPWENNIYAGDTISNDNLDLNYQ